jgi:hypothetical protein
MGLAGNQSAASGHCAGMHRCREGHGWPGAASYINRECLGLIGPNGAGKSTPLKMLNGLHS